MIRIVFVIALLLPASAARAADAYACFGAMRYVAMADGRTCEDLRGFCETARGFWRDAGSDDAAAEKKARELGYSSTTILIARRFCRGRRG